ncbi:MAG: DUF4382 domain-containing protein [Candidatus Micrarchaeia archaeon]|jgi:DNA-binding transcriptional ArsR family regulator
MSKFGETKKRIIGLLSEKNMTLSEISSRLNLAPSTVAQHLQELEEDGAIKKSDEQHSKKWVYYELNRSRGVKVSSNRLGKFSIGIAVVLIALLGISYLFAYMPQNAELLNIGPNSTILPGVTAFSVSDAPSLYNVTSLYIRINKIELHSIEGKWYRLNTNTSLDLVQLRNISKVIAAAKIPSGTYNEIVLSIGGANATINGDVVGVFVPSHNLRIVTTFNITNDSANAVNIDFKLEESIHILGNGNVILAPVIGISYGYNKTMITKESILHKAKWKDIGVFGMNENGTMVPNKELGYWIHKKRNKIESASNNTNPPVIIVKSPHILSIQIGNGSLKSNITDIIAHVSLPIIQIESKGSTNATNASVGNIGVSGNGITCKIEKNIIICKSSENMNPKNVSNLLQNLTANTGEENITGNIISPERNQSYELTKISSFYKNVNSSIFSCNAASDCVLVPTTPCQNNLPSQVACINRDYYPEYMFYYNQMKEHRPIMCPMFIAPGQLSCACMNHTCNVVYNPAMP